MIIDIYDYATQVIPEFDFPGHSHAAIMAMKVRAERSQNDSLRLDDPDDESKSLSVQMFRDNAVNPCIESTYKFLQILVQTIKEMHKGINYCCTLINFLIQNPI